MLKAVIFDFGQVLTLPQDKDSIIRMIAISGLSPEDFKKRYFEHRPDYDRESVSGYEYWRRVIGNDKLNNDILKELVSEDIKSWTKINNHNLELAKKIKQKGYKIGILSDMPRDILNYIDKEFDWLSIFDLKIFSCNIGMAKPEPRIFKFLLKKLELNAQDVIFIDDKKGHIEAAKRENIIGIYYNPEEGNLNNSLSHLLV